MREMTIEAIRVSLMNYHRVVVLKEKDSNRFLPIWIGAPEADAIAVRQQGVSVPRPMTHDLLSSVISQLGSKILRIVVTEITNETFFARILLEVNGEEVEVDSRPSDAIALAVRAEVPIFCEDVVLDQAGVLLDEVGAVAETGDRDTPPKVRAEELEGMSAFRDFIDGLDLDDFGDK